MNFEVWIQSAEVER